MPSHSPHACSAREYTPSQAQSIGVNLPLWVSATGRIRKSQSLKLVLDTLWKKPLPTTSTSSPRERSHVGSITTRVGHQAMHRPALRVHHSQLEIQTRPLKQAQQWRNGSRSQLWNRIFTHRFYQSNRGCARTITDNTGFSTLRNARGILAEVGLVVPFHAAYTLR
jgi:hypothetical protein